MTISQHTFTAQLGSGTILNVRSSSIKLDESWSPYCQGTITITTPADLSTIDPRAEVRVKIAASVRYGGIAFTSDLTVIWSGQLTSSLSTKWGGRLTSDISLDPLRLNWNSVPITASARTANLSLRSRTVNLDGTTTLTVSTDEAYLQDLRNTSTLGFLNFTTLRGFITAIFTSILAGTESMHSFVLEPGLDDAPMPAGLNTADPTNSYQFLPMGATFWEIIAPFVQAANLRLWCDLDGKFYLTQRDLTIVGQIAVKAAVNMTDARDLIDRDSDEWADNVVMRWRYTDTAGVQFTATDYWPLVNTSPGKTMLIDVDGVPPFGPLTPYAQRPAAQVLARIKNRGHQIPATAISDYSATPFQSTRIEFPSSPPQLGLLASVAWSYPEGTMTVESRNLVNA